MGQKHSKKKKAKAHENEKEECKDGRCKCCGREVKRVIE